MRLSYRKLQSFSDCARQYRYAYIERLQRPPVRGLAFQRRMHRALRRFHQYPNAQDSPVIAIQTAWQGVWEEDDVRSYDDQPEFAEGADILRRYAQREAELQRVPAYLEYDLTHSFGPYTLTGRLDRMDFTDDGGYSLIDYKLDKTLPRENAAVENRQLAFYAFLVEQGPGLPVRDVRLYFLRHGVEQVYQPTASDLQTTLGWIEGTAKAIKRERRWEPVEGQHCRACPYWKECPLKLGKERPLQGVWQQADLDF